MPLRHKKRHDIRIEDRRTRRAATQQAPVLPPNFSTDAQVWAVLMLGYATGASGSAFEDEDVPLLLQMGTPAELS